MAALNTVIFAAGQGSRLGGGIPKLLVEVDGQPIYWHQLQAIGDLDTEVYIVCGFRASHLVSTIVESVAKLRLARPRLTFIYNDDYRDTQVVSIRRVLESIATSRRTIFIDGDMIFSRDSFAQLAQSDRTLVLLRESISADGVIAQTVKEQILQFRRQPTGALEWGNLAVYQPDALTIMRQVLDTREHRHHFELINAMIGAGCKTGFAIAELAEVDTAEDLVDAEKFVRAHRRD